ncbi:MAG: hypothetical protein IJU01_02895 [Lachnospiraceae bacterium]|nr:hypothetical protein [Lachnospiraceae bacterium]
MKKAFDEKGASIAMALIYLVIVSVLSCAVLFSGSFYAHRKAVVTAERNAIYQAAGTVALFRKEIEGAVINVSEDDTPLTLGGRLESGGMKLLSGVMAEAVISALRGDYEFRREYELITEGGYSIKGVLGMNKGFDVTVEILTVSADGEEPELKPRMIIFGCDTSREDGALTLEYGTGEMQ